MENPTQRQYYSLVRKAAEKVGNANDLLDKAHTEMVAARAAMFDALELDPESHGRHSFISDKQAVILYADDVCRGLGGLIKVFGSMPHTVLTEGMQAIGIEEVDYVDNGGCLEEVRRVKPLQGPALLQVAEGLKQRAVS